MCEVSIYNAVSWSWNKTRLKRFFIKKSDKQFYCNNAVMSISVQQTTVCPLVISNKNILSGWRYRQNNREHSSTINMPTEHWVPWMHPVQLAALEFIALEQSPLFNVCVGQPVYGCLSIVHQSWSACLWMSQHCAPVFVHQSWSACLWMSQHCAPVLVSLSVDVSALCILVSLSTAVSVVHQSWSASLWLSKCFSLGQPVYGC